MKASTRHHEGLPDPPPAGNPSRRLTIEGSSVGLARLDRHGTVQEANPAFCRLLGYTGGCVGHALRDRFESAAATASDRRHRPLAGTLARALASTGACTLMLHEPGGATVQLHLGESCDGARVATAITMPIGTSLGCQEQATLVDAARTDPLTGLGNRNRLAIELQAWSPSDSETLAVIVLDLDRFKPVNDTLGHATGDRLLGLVADRLRRVSRAGDTVVRLGGDEFVVLCPCEADGAPAERLAGRLIEMVARPFLIDGQQLDIGASAGISCLGDGTADRDDLLRHADLALHEAKARGRGTWHRFETALDERARARRDLEQSLRRALLLREFALVYQPQVRTPDARTTGFEALIRWHRPGVGTVSPLDFVPLAERTGEIHAIGEWVLQEACREAMTWPAHLCVAVNVSPVQFDDERFVDIVVDALHASGLPAARLEIEITEGVLIEDPARTLAVLERLRALGVSIAMDDFGTGFSSLGYLSSFPFSRIKIDQSFVRGEQTERSRALVRSILLLGDSLSMPTLAEGVETEQQFRELIEGGCGNAQGYLFSRPLEPHRIAAYLEARTDRQPPDTSDDTLP